MFLLLQHPKPFVRLCAYFGVLRGKKIIDILNHKGHKGFHEGFTKVLGQVLILSTMKLKKM